MDRTRLAELALRVVISPARAEGIVGDTVELSAGRSTIFWGHIFCVLIAYCWWPTLAFLLTLPVGFAIGLVMAVQASRHFWLGPVHQPTLLFEASRCQLFANSLCSLTAFALLRYGARERIWMLSASAAMLTTGMTVSLWHRELQPIIVVGAVFLILWSLSSRQWRSSAALLVICVSFGVAVQQGASVMLALCFHHVNGPWLERLLGPLIATTPMMAISFALLRRDWSGDRERERLSAAIS